MNRDYVSTLVVGTINEERVRNDTLWKRLKNYLAEKQKAAARAEQEQVRVELLKEKMEEERIAKKKAEQEQAMALQKENPSILSGGDLSDLLLPEPASRMLEYVLYGVLGTALVAAMTVIYLLGTMR